jgi:hypothetical protein
MLSIGLETQLNVLVGFSRRAGPLIDQRIFKSRSANHKFPSPLSEPTGSHFTVHNPTPDSQ